MTAIVRLHPRAAHGAPLFEIVERLSRANYVLSRVRAEHFHFEARAKSNVIKLPRPGVEDVFAFGDRPQ